MSKDEVVKIASLGLLTPAQWEKKVDMVLRMNGWEWWADRVLPAGPLLSAGVPRKSLPAALKIVNSYRRKSGMPDRLVRKTFWPEMELPWRLQRALETGGWPTVWDPGRLPFTAIGFIECKTGSGTTTDAQQEWLDAAALCPGVFSYVAHPARYDELVGLLGGERP